MILQLLPLVVGMVCVDAGFYNAIKAPRIKPGTSYTRGVYNTKKSIIFRSIETVFTYKASLIQVAWDSNTTSDNLYEAK